MSDNAIGLTIQPQGFFTIRTDKRGVLAEFPNLITNSGLDSLASARYSGACFVGTGTLPPTVDDIQLQNRIAESTFVSSSIEGCNNTAPYYSYFIRTFRFAAGSAMGNLTEVGIGDITHGVRSLFSRSLIKDSFGNPTAITLLPEEILEVTYELRHYIPTSDVTGSITFTGNLAGTYSYTIRSARVTTYTGNGNPYGWGSRDPYVRLIKYAAAAYPGALEAITGFPTGYDHQSDDAIIYTYIDGSYTSKITYMWSIASGNVPGGIRSVLFTLGIGKYQIEFNPPIPKTSTDALSLTFTNNWARRP